MNTTELQSSRSKRVTAAAGCFPAYAGIPEWCRLSGMSRTATYLAMGRGDIKAIKAGARTLVDVEAALAWMRSLPAAQITAPKSAD